MRGTAYTWCYAYRWAKYTWARRSKKILTEVNTWSYVITRRKNYMEVENQVVEIVRGNYRKSSRSSVWVCSSWKEDQMSLWRTSGYPRNSGVSTRRHHERRLKYPKSSEKETRCHHEKHLEYPKIFEMRHLMLSFSRWLAQFWTSEGVWEQNFGDDCGRCRYPKRVETETSQESWEARELSKESWDKSIPIHAKQEKYPKRS